VSVCERTRQSRLDTRLTGMHSCYTEQYWNTIHWEDHLVWDLMVRDMFSDAINNDEMIFIHTADHGEVCWSLLLRLARSHDSAFITDRQS